MEGKYEVPLNNSLKNNQVSKEEKVSVIFEEKNHFVNIFYDLLFKMFYPVNSLKDASIIHGFPSVWQIRPLPCNLCSTRELVVTEDPQNRSCQHGTPPPGLSPQCSPVVLGVSSCHLITLLGLQGLQLPNYPTSPLPYHSTTLPFPSQCVNTK